MSAIKLKKSAVSGKAPTTSDLQFGEIALNYADGVLYFKKSNNTIGYISAGAGSGPASMVRRIYEVTATSGQTTFTIPDGYSTGLVDVVINGSELFSTDYSAADGSTVVLTQAAVAGDTIKFVIYDVVTLANSYTKIQVDDLISQLNTSKANNTSLATVATSGSYNDLLNKPTLFSGSYTDLTNTPTLFSGSYTDLTSLPQLFSGSYTDLTNKPTLFSGSYADLTSKPTIPSITGLASETYVNTAISNLINGAPTTLDTLKEIADQLAADQNSVSTIITTLGTKVNTSSLATVATSGSYNDLVNKPTLFSGSYADLTSKPNLFSGSYNDLTNKPTQVVVGFEQSFLLMGA